MAVNRPFKGGFLLKGAYTFSKALNETDDDGWTGRDVEPAVAVSPQLRAGRLRPSAHAADGLRVRAALLRESTDPVALRGQELADQRHRVVDVGHAVHDRRRQRPAAAAGRHADDQRDRRGQAGLRRGGTRTSSGTTRPCSTSAGGNAWGNSGRNAFRGPSNWNLDASLFRTIPFGHYSVEIRVESQNVFNHAQWGNPVTGFTDANFMRIRAWHASAAHGTGRRALHVLVSSLTIIGPGQPWAAPAFFCTAARAAPPSLKRLAHQAPARLARSLRSWAHRRCGLSPLLRGSGARSLPAWPWDNDSDALRSLLAFCCCPGRPGRNPAISPSAAGPRPAPCRTAGSTRPRGCIATCCRRCRTRRDC